MIVAPPSSAPPRAKAEGTRVRTNTNRGQKVRVVGVKSIPLCRLYPPQTPGSASELAISLLRSLRTLRPESHLWPTTPASRARRRRHRGIAYDGAAHLCHSIDADHGSHRAASRQPRFPRSLPEAARAARDCATAFPPQTRHSAGRWRSLSAEPCCAHGLRPHRWPAAAACRSAAFVTEASLNEAPHRAFPPRAAPAVRWHAACGPAPHQRSVAACSASGITGEASFRQAPIVLLAQPLARAQSARGLGRVEERVFAFRRGAGRGGGAIAEAAPPMWRNKWRAISDFTASNSAVVNVRPSARSMRWSRKSLRRSLRS